MTKVFQVIRKFSNKPQSSVRQLFILSFLNTLAYLESRLAILGK